MFKQQSVVIIMAKKSYTVKNGLGIVKGGRMKDIVLPAHREFLFMHTLESSKMLRVPAPSEVKLPPKLRVAYNKFKEWKAQEATDLILLLANGDITWRDVAQCAMAQSKRVISVMLNMFFQNRRDEELAFAERFLDSKGYRKLLKRARDLGERLRERFIMTDGTGFENANEIIRAIERERAFQAFERHRAQGR